MVAGDVTSSIVTNNGKKCINLNGTSAYLSMTKTLGEAISANNEITVSFWFKISDDSNAFSYFFAKDSDMLRINIKRDTSVVTVSFFGLTDTSISASPAAIDGEWHHLITGYNGTHIFLTIDGVEVTPEASTGTLAMTNDPIYIGSYDGAQYFVPGSMADIQIWDRGLSSANQLKVYQGQNIAEDRILNVTFKDNDYSDHEGNYTVTNHGTTVGIVDHLVAKQVETLRTTANDHYLIAPQMRGQVVPIVIEEAP